VFKKVLFVATLAVTGLLMTPGESWAQRGGRGGGGRGGWSGGRGWEGGRGGWGIGIGYGGWGGYGYPGYYGGYGYRSYYDYPDYYASPSYVTPSAYYAPPSATEEQEATNDNRAFVQVRVSANAEVWFEGDRTSQTGAMRSFISPPLQPGKTFTYDIRARWMDPSGKPVDQTRQVKVQAGRRSMVDFMASANTIDRPADADLNRNRLPENRDPEKRVPDTKKNELPLPKQP